MPRRGKPAGRKHVEALVDEMSKESFPASDAPQLVGALDRDPADLPRHPPTHAPPPEVAPEDDTKLDVREGRYPLGDAGEAWVRTGRDGVDVRLPAAKLHLDPAALEQLIAALERHRPPLHGGR